MSDLATPSSEGSHSSLRPRPLNFSRPRPTQADSTQKLQHDATGSAATGVSTFHEPSRDLPAEPRFSIDSQQTSSARSVNSAASEFAWDGQSGELRSKRRPHEYEHAQRYSRGFSRSATSDSQASNSTAVGSDRPLLSELPGSQPPPIPAKLPKIVKRMSVDQQSEHRSISSSARGDFEDDASHHTVSVDGEGGILPEGKWSSSGYDTSGLSVAEIHKLRKKGINPALYAEMKAARKGKGKWVGPLVGNTYIG
ncbi:hypothetical protein LTR36_008152 [Oleoguttula mirabilis]|uniref:Uncharacterized protein n=1 Tax=Oleoguttula mirabilis TaxID=1507867 RepID=A0AAV9J904_9PEZI|nr:hypothetical protein LTR36_008152 [Oleoguttula mirabilis]